MCRLCTRKLTYNHSTGSLRKHIQLRHLHLPLQPTNAVMYYIEPECKVPSHTTVTSVLFNSYLNVILLTFVNCHVFLTQCALTVHNRWLKVAHISVEMFFCFKCYLLTFIQSVVMLSRPNFPLNPVQVYKSIWKVCTFLQ